MYDQYGKMSEGSGTYFLKKNNRALAAKLNANMLQTKGLKDKINVLNEENMDLRVKLAEIKQNMQLSKNNEYKENCSIGTQRTISTNSSLSISEEELQNRIAKLLEPLKASLLQSLNYSVRLSDSLSESLELATIPGITASSLSCGESSPAELELAGDGAPKKYEGRSNGDRNNLSLPTRPLPSEFSKKIQLVLQEQPIKSLLLLKSTRFIKRQRFESLNLAWMKSKRLTIVSSLVNLMI